MTSIIENQAVSYLLNQATHQGHKITKLNRTLPPKLLAVTYLFVVIQDSVHVFNPHSINRPIKDQPLAVWSLTQQENESSYYIQLQMLTQKSYTQFTVEVCLDQSLFNNYSPKAK